MNIKTRFYFLTALNICICIGVGLVGYFGVERLDPQHTSSIALREGVRSLDAIKLNQEAMRSAVLEAVALTRTRSQAFGSLEGIKSSLALSAKALEAERNKLQTLGIPESIRQSVIADRYPTEQLISSALALPDQLDKNFDSTLPQLQSFMSVFEHLRGNCASNLTAIHAAVDAERLWNINFGHSIQNTVASTLLLGTASIIILVLITLRSILRPIDDVIRALGLSAAEVDVSAQKMSLCAEDLAQSATEQAAAVQESVASMTQMSSMIAQTGDSSTESLTNVRRMAERTEDGNRIMERLASSTEAINQANVQLREMVDIIAEISAKTSVINDIVFKTQLLSFNASIEAARAGQHGRGFAVVAEEFGNLAEMSGQAAKDIQSLLETSKKHVAEIVEMTHQRVSDGQAVSKDALAIFHEISRETSHITKQIQRISEATREQQIGVQQSSTAMNQMDQAAQRNSLLAGDTLRSASDLSEQSRKLTSIMQGLLSLISAERREQSHEAAESHHSHSRKASAHTHVLELDDHNVMLDQAFLNDASTKLAGRAKAPLKGELHSSDEDFQPYQGQAPR